MDSDSDVDSDDSHEEDTKVTALDKVTLRGVNSDLVLSDSESDESEPIDPVVLGGDHSSSWLELVSKHQVFRVLSIWLGSLGKQV